MALLEISNVSLSFGGLRALSHFNFSLDRGELVALIGPNGAGKTTAFNVVTGVYAPHEGTLLIGRQSIRSKKPFRINRLGIARTFQNIRLFTGLSVLENVLVAENHSIQHSLASAVLRTSGFTAEESRQTARAMEILETFSLSDRADDPAGSLPYGQQRRLEIARALATDPKILLLDEPAAGMNPNEKLQLIELIQFIRDRFKVGIWLIEHDMNLIMSISERITVLDHGEIIAVGPPSEIRTNPKVIEAYLGGSA